jgi:DNA-binding NtrC family response regulator
LVSWNGTRYGQARFKSGMAQAFTVLFVEDDTQVRESTARLLAAKGFRLLVAQDSIEAMRVLAQEHVDVLFTDIVMPEFNGIELAKQAKRMRPNLHVVFITGYYSRAAEAMPLGKLLFKPVRIDQIDAEIRELLTAH